MKTVKLLVQKGTNKANSIVEYDDSSAEWLVSNGYALEVTTQKETKAATKPADEAPAAPRRGRPRKADKS